MYFLGGMMNEFIIREYREKDLSQMVSIWNEVVEAGDAFPQQEVLTSTTGKEFFAIQSFTGVLEKDGTIIGLYILHPNNVGRCAHIANASYAIKASERGAGLGEKLVLHSLTMGKKFGFHLLQFNAVVKTNLGAIHLYEKLGFHKICEVPGGFCDKNGEYKDIVHFYRALG